MGSITRHRSRGWRELGVLVVSILLVSACAEEPTTELNVSAAASLSAAFSEIEASFEAANPDVDVVLNLGGSSLLSGQILEGAPIDVFAPASLEIMKRVSDSGAISGSPEVFATNVATIGVPVGNPASVAGVADLVSVRLLGVCAPVVPCGDLAEEVFSRANIDPSPVTEEPNVRALVTKIEAGELDAGIVYRTDVESANIVGVPIPTEFEAATSYPIAVTSQASASGPASDFVEFVLGSDGRAILVDNGFELP